MKTRIVSKICGLMVFFPLVTFSQSTVQGIVSESNSNSPIAGAKVIIDKSFGAISDLDGNYQIENVPSGEHTIQFIQNEYDTLEMSFSTKPAVPVSYLNGVMVPSYYFVLDSRNNGEASADSPDLQKLEEVVILYVNPGTPTTYNTLKTKEIEQNNFGQDLPYLLQMTPSTVVTSDAGAGVGYVPDQSSSPSSRRRSRAGSRCRR